MMKTIIQLILLIITPIFSIKLNDPFGNLLKSIYKPTYNGFEIELEPFLNFKYSSDGFLEHNTGVITGDSYHVLDVSFGNGEYHIFEPTRMNQLKLGWGVKDEEFKVDFNQTGEFDNLPEILKRSGIFPNKQLLNEGESASIYTHYRDNFQLNANIRKRSIGIKSEKTILDPTLFVNKTMDIPMQNKTTVESPSITLKTSWDIGFSNIRYSQKGIEVILRSTLKTFRDHDFPHHVPSWNSYNKVPNHFSNLFVTFRLAHPCLGPDMILTDGCRTMTKIHGGIGASEYDKKPIKPIAMTTHKKLIGNSFEIFVDVLKQPIQHHSFALDDKGYIRYYAWWKNMVERYTLENPAHILTIPGYPVCTKLSEKTQEKIQEIPIFQLFVLFQENRFAINNETREAKRPFDLLLTFITYYDEISNSLTDEFDFSEIVKISGIDTTAVYQIALLKDDEIAREGDFNTLLQELASELNVKIIEFLQLVGNQIASKRDYLHRLTGPEGKDKFVFYFDME